MPLKCLCLFHRTNKVHNPIKDDILSFDCACGGCFTFVESASGMVRMFWYLFMLFNCRQRLLGETLLRLNELGKRSLWVMLTRCTLSHVRRVCEAAAAECHSDGCLWYKVKEAADLMTGLRACLTTQIAALSWRDDLSHSDNRSRGT